MWFSLFIHVTYGMFNTINLGYILNVLVIVIFAPQDHCVYKSLIIIVINEHIKVQIHV